MEHPSVGEACELYWIAEHGQRLLCPRPYDCGFCPNLQEWIYAQRKNGIIESWECEKCLKNPDRDEEFEKGMYRMLAGYYHHGQCDTCAEKHILLNLTMRKKTE